MCPPGTKRRLSNKKQKILLMPHCVTCGEGHYQDRYNQPVCLKCPINQTSPSAATSRSECYLPKSHEACTMQSNQCENQGQCVLFSDQRYHCKCTDRFYGWRCTKQMNPCLSGPCFNEGLCHPNGNQFTCQCSSDFEGDYCEVPVSKCQLGFCLNNGKCNKLPNGEAQCVCSFGFVGDRCEISQDQCSLDCKHGKCVNSQNGAFCKCHPGYLGRRCHLQPCDTSPCPKNEVCINLKDPLTTFRSYSCQNRITQNPCKPNPCRNNGDCLINRRKGGPMAYTCICPFYFFGDRCETFIRPNFELHYKNADVGNYVQLPGPTRDLKEVSLINDNISIMLNVFL